jgi:protease I
MKALILTGRGVQDHEFIYPYYRMQEAGYDVDVAVRGGQEFTTIGGLKFKPTRDVTGLRDDYKVVIIPGGVKAMEHMRLDEALVHTVLDYHAAGGVVAAICSGVQLLISAGLARGRRMAIYPAFRVDLENAGGEFVDMPAVADDRIITSPHYRYLGAWMSATLTVMASR